MKSIQEIKQLKLDAIRLETLFDKHLERIKDTSCDKHGIQFGGDSRFAVFSTQVFLDCHTGYYGNSNCGSPFSIDSKKASQWLNKYLNANMRNVLAGMAKYARQEAMALEGKAREEIEAANKLLNELLEIENTQEV